VKQELQIESSGAEQANIAGGGDNVELLKAKISKQGDKVRELKTSGAAKDVVDTEVKILLGLKQELKDLTGEDTTAGSSGKKKGKGKASKPTEKPAKQKEPSKESKPAPAAAELVQGVGDDSEAKKHLSRLGLEVKKEENFSEWYSQVR
jgi:hypothetical protein